MCAIRLVVASTLFRFLFLLNIFSQKIEARTERFFSIKITRFAVVARCYLLWCCSIRAKCTAVNSLPPCCEYSSIKNFIKTISLEKKKDSKNLSHRPYDIVIRFCCSKYVWTKIWRTIKWSTLSCILRTIQWQTRWREQPPQQTTMKRLTIQHEWERKKIMLKPNGRSNASRCCKYWLYVLRHLIMNDFDI